MTNPAEGKPRRALLSDEPLDDEPTGVHRPSRAIWSTLDGDDVDDDGAGTPVPPPVVLPEVDRSARGRRFQALGDDAGYQPRRSAASVSSPPHLEPGETWSPAEPAATPEPDRPTLPPPPQFSEAADDGGQAPAQKAPGFWADRRQRLIALAVIGVAVLALIAGLVLSNLPRAGTVSPTASNTAANATSPADGTPDAAMLLNPDELAGVASPTWTIAETTTAPTASSPQPICLPATTESQQAATNRQSRRLTGSSAGATALQHHEVYPNAEAATAAYTARLPQLGGCAGSTALIAGYTTVDGLADAAVTATVIAQEAKAETHTILMARTGRFIDIVDLGGTGKAVSATALAKAMTASLQRQCTVAEGTCPTTPKTTATLLPTSEVEGWLAENDLPRITAGAGRWGATPAQAPLLVGSQCEAIDLNKIPKATEQLHRTYLLADDGKAPSGFGVDEAQYTFASASDAGSVVKKVTANIEGCRARTRTATVKTLTPATAAGQDAEKLTVNLYSISQRISETKSVEFRVGIATAGKRLVYLLANPSGGFDFTDQQWSDLGARAAQRATQG